MFHFWELVPGHVIQGQAGHGVELYVTGLERNVVKEIEAALKKRGIVTPVKHLTRSDRR